MPPFFRDDEVARCWCSHGVGCWSIAFWSCYTCHSCSWDFKVVSQKQQQSSQSQLSNWGLFLLLFLTLISRPILIQLIHHENITQIHSYHVKKKLYFSFSSHGLRLFVITFIFLFLSKELKLLLLFSKRTGESTAAVPSEAVSFWNFNNDILIWKAHTSDTHVSCIPGKSHVETSVAWVLLFLR